MRSSPTAAAAFAFAAVEGDPQDQDEVREAVGHVPALEAAAPGAILRARAPARP
jgi:hypothetical protein